jgi:hypothetical protein
MTARPPAVITPISFSQALEAAGLIHDRDRITDITIRAKPGELVTIEVTYVADERIYTLAKPGDEYFAEADAARRGKVGS